MKDKETVSVKVPVKMPVVEDDALLEWLTDTVSVLDVVSVT